MSPEMRAIVKGENPQDGVDSFNLEKVDIFSVGLICLEALRNLGFDQMAKLNTYTEGEKLIAELLKNIKSQTLSALLKGLLVFSPKLRFDMATGFNFVVKIQKQHFQ